MKDDPEIRQILAECFLSTKMFSKTIFPERFTRPFSKITDEIFRVLDDDSLQKVVIAAPRGWGKTSIANMAFPAKKILFQDSKFVVPISCTATQAVLQGENLKRKLMTSQRVKKFFGPMKSDVFAKDMWITSTGTMVLPRGAGQQVRGFLSDDDRPDLIIVDDLEDKEAVSSIEQRAKLKEWFFADVMNSVDKSSRKWKIVVIGTVLHEDALLVNLLEDPSWHSVKLELCDDNYTSNWPDYMTTDEIRQLAEDYSKQGLLHVFFMEYRNTVISADAPFKKEYFRYYEDDFSMNKDKDVETVVILDPAKTTNPKSAFSAIVGIGFNAEKSMISIRDVVNERLHPDEQYTAAFDMCKRLNARVLGYETTGLGEFISYPIKSAMLRTGLNLELVELKAKKGVSEDGKKERIRTLIPFYRQGLIQHNVRLCSALENQLLAFPRSKFWDVMDATAYMVEIFELGERYLSAEDQEDPLEDEKDLYDDDSFDQVSNWRAI